MIDESPRGGLARLAGAVQAAARVDVAAHHARAAGALVEATTLALTEHGLCVADGVRGVTFQQLPPPPGLDADAPGAMIEDGFCARNSGRPDLYPHAPQQRGASHVLAGRLDQVTAPDAAEKAEAVEVPAVQLAARP